MGPQVPILCIVAGTFSVLASQGANADTVAGTGKISYPAYAEVVRADKITTREQQNTPIKRCTWEQLPSRVHYERYGERRVVERRAKRCRTTYDTRTVERVTGYQVTLRYNGETFTRRTLTHPGRRVPITVDLEPINPP